MAGLVGGSVAMAGLASLGGYSLANVSGAAAVPINFQCGHGPYNDPANPGNVNPSSDPSVGSIVTWSATSATPIVPGVFTSPAGSDGLLSLLSVASGSGTILAPTPPGSTSFSTASTLAPGQTLTIGTSSYTVTNVGLGQGVGGSNLISIAPGIGGTKTLPANQKFTYAASSAYSPTLTSNILVAQANDCAVGAGAPVDFYPTGGLTGTGYFTQKTVDPNTGKTIYVQNTALSNSAAGLQGGTQPLQVHVHYGNAGDGSYAATNNTSPTLNFTTGGAFTTVTVSGFHQPVYNFKNGTLSGTLKSSKESASLALAGLVVCTQNQLGAWKALNYPAGWTTQYCDGGPQNTTGVTDPQTAAQELGAVEAGGPNQGSDGSPILAIAEVVTVGSFGVPGGSGTW